MILRNTGSGTTSRTAHPLLYIRYMKILALALCLPFAACTVGDGNTTTPGGDDDTMNPNPDPNPNPNPNPTPTGLSGTIAANATWAGATLISGAVTIPVGVTVTVSAGAAITLSASANITVSGTLDVEGTKALPVTIGPDVAAGHWGGVDVMTGGTYTLKYGTQTGGGLYTDGGTANVTDSQMSNASGDYLVMNGGSIDVEYSTIGVEAPGPDSTHCNLHFNSASSIKFTHNNNLNSPFGLMFYGGTGADFTHNNWVSDKTAGDVDIEPAPMGTGDFSNSYFSNGQPAGVTGLTFNTLSTTRLTDCGPR